VRWWRKGFFSKNNFQICAQQQIVFKERKKLEERHEKERSLPKFSISGQGVRFSDFL